ncbi:unnamed protein product, partial [Didymodactylos carnosus]
MPRGAKKEKIKKDPNAPKKPLSAYFLFSRDERQKIKIERPELSTTEIMKVIGERWSNLSDDIKKPYEKLALSEKQRYQEELATYQKETGDGDNLNDMSSTTSVLPLRPSMKLKYISDTNDQSNFLADSFQLSLFGSSR